MDPLSIAAVGWSITAVGWLMGALVNKAVGKLQQWARRNGLGDEFKTLKNQLTTLNTLLRSAHRLPPDNSSLEEMVEELQQLAYRADNLLDELDYYQLQDQIQQRDTQENVNCMNKSSAASSSSSFWLGRSILSLLKCMSCRSARDVLVSLPETSSSRNDLPQRMTRLAEQLRESEKKVRKAVNTESQAIYTSKTEISHSQAAWQTSSFVTEPRVFGRDQECEKLINRLRNEESAIVGEVPVVAIVGSGGVGKTTLAQVVFNDPKVHSYFAVKFWICVSTRFDIDRLTREMLERACGNRYGDFCNLATLQNKLEEELMSKRFLLVLDNMWEDENDKQWKSMVAPFSNCKVKGSIILVTARNKSVANMVNARDIIYLEGLDDAAFLSYFSTCIFNDTNFGGNSRLRTHGELFANKLKGNPLATKTVSALLKDNHDERYWKKIRESEVWNSQDGPNDIMPVLRLSYEHMPFHLQRCFSYCAMLPKDHTFTCEELVYLWMAQGFLDVASKIKRMEDIGKDYFNDLLNRGVFQTIQSTDGGLVYRFHDMLYNLACMVSSNECLSINGTNPSQIPPTIRHLSIFNCTERGKADIVSTLECLEGENLSTIINWDELPPGIFPSILGLLGKTKFLRAVRLNIQEHNFIQNFVCLRYLRLSFISSMSDNSIANPPTFPIEICRLYHLEVFVIDGAGIVELPNNFNDLVRLRHFIVQWRELHSKIRGVGKLTSLQELNHFVVQEDRGFEIGQLGSLKEIRAALHISNLENVKSEREANNALLEEKEQLEALYLKWNHGKQENKSVLEGLKPNTFLKSLVIDGYGGVASPTWLDRSLTYLESLTLQDCTAWKLLPPLGELEFLKHLKLSRLAVREIGPHCYSTSQSQNLPDLEKFQSLEELQIINMPDLKKWVWSDQFQLFVRLKKLTIQGCTKLVDLPLLGCDTSKALKRFPFLESLIIEDCPLISQLPPLPYSSLLSFISIKETGFAKSMRYEKQRQYLSLTLDNHPSLNVGELLAFHELSSLGVLEISTTSNLKYLDLEDLVGRRCQSLTSFKIITLEESLDLHSV